MPHHPDRARCLDVLDRLGWAAPAVQLADAAATAARHYPDVDPDRPALLHGVRAPVAPLVDRLRRHYPADHPVSLWCVAEAGMPPRRIDLALGDLDDGSFEAAAHTEIPAPPAGGADAAAPAPTAGAAILALPPRPGFVLDLGEVIAHLRAPDGCPWDREQTHRSLRPYLLEEAHEALDALDAGDAAALCEELGDLLLQIALHAQIAAEAGTFTLADVVRGLTAKLIRRHPHVFGDVRADTADDVRRNWEALKQGERAAGAKPADPFAGLPAALPALARAQAVQERASRLAGAGAADAGDAEALARATLAGGAPPPMPAAEAARAAHVGALLWSTVALARAWGVDAESALRETTARAARGGGA